MNKEIDKYMTVAEAANRWDISQETIKSKLKPSIPTTWAQTQAMIKEGMLKYYQKPESDRKEWIITTDAMEKWFGKKQSF